MLVLGSFCGLEIQVLWSMFNKLLEPKNNLDYNNIITIATEPKNNIILYCTMETLTFMFPTFDVYRGPESSYLVHIKPLFLLLCYNYTMDTINNHILIKF